MRAPKRPNDNKRHVVSVSGTDELAKWMEMIGTKNDAQFSRYLIWKKFGFCPSNTSLSQREDILNGKLAIS